ncbi:type I restriction endonuclease [Arthrospira sp. PCC 9108]|nr:type I restriction endonuclease [Arthrospira sp. PCC 9108]
MIKVGQVERVTQNRVIKLFQNQLGYTYLGNWKDRENNGNIEAEYLTQWLTQQGIKDTLINKTLRELDKAASLGETQNLYDANKAVYRLLRYGVKVKGGRVNKLKRFGSLIGKIPTIIAFIWRKK